MRSYTVNIELNDEEVALLRKLVVETNEWRQEKGFLDRWTPEQELSVFARYGLWERLQQFQKASTILDALKESPAEFVSQFEEVQVPDWLKELSGQVQGDAR